MIILLFKYGDQKQCENYKLIALTLIVSKILEKCVKSKLMALLDKHAVFLFNRFGFRSNISTIDP